MRDPLQSTKNNPTKNIRNTGVFFLIASIVACKIPMLIALVALSTATTTLAISPTIRIVAIVFAVIGVLLLLGAFIYRSKLKEGL